MSRTVTTIDYKALAGRLSSLADELAAFGHHTSEQRVDDLRTVVSLLRHPAPQPTAIPAPFMHLLGHAYGLSLGTDWNRGTHAKHYRRPLLDAVAECKRWLGSAPPPQPEPAQPKRRPYGTDTMSEMGIAPMCDEPQPERQPVSEPTEAQIELQYALDRMSTPLHASRLSGATAAEDARCMAIIRAEIDRLTRERDALAKDAERYRFLRTRHVVETMNDGELCIHYACDFEYYNDPDASIDAALAVKDRQR